METRLKSLVDPTHGRDHNRIRVLLVMERFLARVDAVLPKSAVLKGGLALELRLERARTTRDLDLRVLGNSARLDEHLRAIESFRPDPDDHFHFTIAPATRGPDMLGAGVKYDGYRFKVTAALAGKPFVSFGLDVAYGDPILGEPDLLRGTDFFDKYGIPPVMIRAYPATTHLAEKLHAYTLPRARVNMRMKDLIDMPLIGLALDGTTASELREAFSLTFDFRDTHPIPSSLPQPPDQWRGPYDRLRAEESLDWAELEDLHAAASALVNPILAGINGSWSATQRQWT